MPTVWDETRGLDGDPDAFAVVARRSGDVWYVVGITNGDPRTYQLNTSFLGGGTWKMETFSDDWQRNYEPSSYRHGTISVRSGESIAFRMMSGGGFAARFTK